GGKPHRGGLALHLEAPDVPAVIGSDQMARGVVDNAYEELRPVGGPGKALDDTTIRREPAQEAAVLDREDRYPALDAGRHLAAVRPDGHDADLIGVRSCVRRGGHRGRGGKAADEL